MFYYLDTSIWLDFHEKRGKNGESALSLIMKIIERNEVLLFSDLHIKELKNLGYSFDEIIQMFKIAKPDIIRHVHLSKEQITEGMRLAAQRNIPKKDALHAVIARDNCAILVSRDKHFEKLKDIIETKVPEEEI